MSTLTLLFLCVHPVARDLAISLVAIALIHGLLLARIGRPIRWPLPAVYCAAVLFTLWLGSLGLSPVGFSNGRLPLLRGFIVGRSRQPAVSIHSGETISLAAGGILAIEPNLLPGPVDCFWLASNGGALDDPQSCDTSYEPALGAAYDVLRLRVRSACGIPTAIGEIKLSMLP